MASVREMFSSSLDEEEFKMAFSTGPSPSEGGPGSASISGVLGTEAIEILRERTEMGGETRCGAGVLGLSPEWTEAAERTCCAIAGGETSWIGGGGSDRDWIGSCGGNGGG